MIASISTRKGKARTMSTSRMKMVSTMPPKIAGDRAERGADDEREEHADDPHLQVDARAPDDAREDIAAEIVGAERMRQDRRLQRAAASCAIGS